MSTEMNKCADCGGDAFEIRIIDKGHGGSHQELEFALIESQRGIWMGKYPITGKVGSFMCGQCGRIRLYGRPNEQ